LNNRSLHTIREVFARIAADDEQAYRELFDGYFQQLYAAILVYTKSVTDAEDIVQSIFLKVWERRNTLTSIDHPENWLFITARNEFLDHFRKLQSQEKYRRSLVDLFHDEGISAEMLIIAAEREAFVRKAIAALPEKQQQAILLSRHDGLTYDEIAVVMGIAKTTVKEHISRALKSIRDFLLSHKDELT
jgi:RNA polymerase sigma-70 factor (family 1)